MIRFNSVTKKILVLILVSVFLSFSECEFDHVDNLEINFDRYGERI